MFELQRVIRGCSSAERGAWYENGRGWVKEVLQYRTARFYVGTDGVLQPTYMVRRDGAGVQSVHVEWNDWMDVPLGKGD